MLRILTTLTLLLAAAPTLSAATWYVDSNADPTGDGSLAQPFARIGEALALAVSGDVVQVAAGIYSNSVPLTVNGFARRALVILPSGVAIRGAGRGQTFLRGRAVDDVFYGVSAEGVGTDSELSDLTVDGYLVQGMSVRGGSPTVRRVDFVNEVTGGSSVAVDVRNAASPTMEDGIYTGGHSSLFIEFGSSGTYRRLTLGARVNESLAVLGSDPLLEDCIIGPGGRDTIVLTTDSDPRLRRCVISKGARWTVRVCCYSLRNLVDLGGNRWYSTDEAVLQADILDATDDASLGARVVVTPLDTQVSRRRESFGAFRARY